MKHSMVAGTTASKGFLCGAIAAGGKPALSLPAPHSIYRGLQAELEVLEVRCWCSFFKGSRISLSN